MKLSQLRTCDKCNGPVGLVFNVLRHSQAVVNVNAARRTIGLSIMLNDSLSLAEVFSDEPDAVMILGDKEADLRSEIYLCQECYAFSDLAPVFETRASKKAADNADYRAKE